MDRKDEKFRERTKRSDITTPREILRNSCIVDAPDVTCSYPWQRSGK